MKEGSSDGVQEQGAALEVPWPVFLIGFMGTGKSTIGRALSGELGMPFIDLDRVVEKDAGKSVPEIFAEDGESQFRSLETAALARVASGGPAVVATGGGAPLHDRNLETMKRAGLVLALDATLEELRRRVEKDGTRPLWNVDSDELDGLFRSRAPTYRRAHAVIQTEGRGISETGRAAVRLVRSATRVERDFLPGASLVALEAGEYPVVVRAGALARLGPQVQSILMDAKRVAIVSDQNVAEHYLEPVAESLRSAGLELVSSIVVEPGEPSKSLQEFARLCEELVAAGLDRSSAVIALGGGVVGDLAGYVAASIFRGIRLVHVPTSLLAMVDSSIGGKTGVNLERGKNLVGSFWQPSLVHADPEVLATLPARERRAAYGELLKYGLLDSEALLQQVEALAAGLGSTEASDDEVFASDLCAVIRRCAAFKAWVVGRDEREQTGERALLNLGHTIGHAIEAAEGYGVLVHGEAVALGLLASCRVSARLGYADATLELRVRDAMLRAGLDADLNRYLRDDVLARVKVDKKRTGDRIGFIVVSEPGRCEQVPLAPEQLARTLRA